jgi:hypothetical protein
MVSRGMQGKRLTEFDEEFSETAILARRKSDNASQVEVIVRQLFLLISDRLNIHGENVRASAKRETPSQSTMTEPRERCTDEVGAGTDSL